MFEVFLKTSRSHWDRLTVEQMRALPKDQLWCLYQAAKADERWVAVTKINGKTYQCRYTLLVTHTVFRNGEFMNDDCEVLSSRVLCFACKRLVERQTLPEGIHEIFDPTSLTKKDLGCCEHPQHQAMMEMLASRVKKGA
jgi:hypothetical protein